MSTVPLIVTLRNRSYESIALPKLKMGLVRHKLGNFRFDYEYEIEYEYGFSNLVFVV